MRSTLESIIVINIQSLSLPCFFPVGKITELRTTCPTYTGLLKFCSNQLLIAFS